MSFLLYVLGMLVVIGGLAWGASMAHVPGRWIAVGEAPRITNAGESGVRILSNSGISPSSVVVASVVDAGAGSSACAKDADQRMANGTTRSPDFRMRAPLADADCVGR